MSDLDADQQVGEVPDLTAIARPIPRAASRYLQAAAFATAVVAHAAVLLALAHDSAEMAGANGQQLDAISITLVSANALEARETEHTTERVPTASDTVDVDDGAHEDARASATKETEKTQKQEQKADEEAVPAAQAMLEAVPQPQPKQEERKERAAPTTQGGIAARSEATAPSHASAAAAASPGAVREFGRYVTLALSRAKPRRSGGYGSVWVKFVIAPSGKLASLEVAKSSGSQALDQKALEAVQLASFPLPPSGMSVTQLTYEIPYHFR